MKSKILLFFVLIFLISCKKNKIIEIPKEDYHIGTLEILSDGSFKSVVEALAGAYEIRYPDTRISVKEMKEDFGLLALMEDKAKLIVMSRELNEYQKSEYERIFGRKCKPAEFAIDGVVFVVGKNATREKITTEEIETGLKDGSQNFIFDGGNTSNISFIAQKINQKQSELKFKTLSGNDGVVKGISKFPNAVGVVSLNTISRIHNEESKALREMVKILPIEDKGVLYYPTLENLKTLKYPYTRTLYFLINERGFKLANGLVRFSGSQVGQKVVEKEGLQPYYLYKREVKMR